MKITIVIAVCLLYISCMKKLANTQVTGTYVGLTGYSNPPVIGPGTVTITSGSGTNGIAITVVNELTGLTATIKGDSITVPKQIGAVGQSAVIDSFYGNGYLRGDSLYLTLQEIGIDALSSPTVEFGGARH